MRYIRTPIIIIIIIIIKQAKSTQMYAIVRESTRVLTLQPQLAKPKNFCYLVTLAFAVGFTRLPV
jgi:hypothetical protein